MAETTTPKETFHPAQAEEDMSIETERASSSTTVSDIAHEKIVPVSEDDLYSADETIGEKKLQILEELPSEKKKKAEFEETVSEDAAPPPYAPASAAERKRQLWKKRWFLLAVIGGLVVLIIVLAVSLGVELSKNPSKSHAGSGLSGTSSSSSSASNPYSPTSPSNPSSPTSSVHSGNAAPPNRNTALAAVTLPGSISSIDPQQDSLVQIFFQDKDYYLCSKNSISGVESWSLQDSGTRILPALNSTPISAVHETQGSNGYIPIRVFFIDARGFLADIYQTTWGGPWVNGSLSERQFTVGDQYLGEGSNSISAVACEEIGVTVYTMSTDGILYAFQLSGDDTDGNGGTWNIIWQDNEAGSVQAVNIAAVCLMPDSSSNPPLFINSFGGTENTGQLVTWFDNTNVTVPLPPAVANLYRPDTPIATVYSSEFPDSEPYGANLTLLLFFPLPTSLTSLSPDPSLHILSATPYWSGKAPIPDSDSFVATDQRLNWNNTQLVDTGIVPYARGAAALFTGSDMSADNGVVDSMPRAWTPLLMEGNDAGRVVIVYQDSELAIQIVDVVGGSGNYQVINSTD